MVWQINKAGRTDGKKGKGGGRENKGKKRRRGKMREKERGRKGRKKWMMME